MITLLMAATASLFLSAQADAQFGRFKDSFSSATDASKEVSAPADVSQESIVQNFLAANDLVDEANAALLEAFGEKERAATYREEAASFSAASTEGDKDAIKDRIVHSQDTSDHIASLIEAGAEISGEGREKYAEGLVLSIESLVATKGLADAAQGFSASAQAQINSASMMQKLKVTKKLAAGMFVAKELPGYASRLIKNVGQLMTFARSADIPTPDDATGLLAGL